MKIIARIYNDFNEKFGIPRQSGIADEVISEVVFEKEYGTQTSIRGIDEYDYIWLIWGFSENKGIWKEAVRPPRLGGNVKKGVFATRSPFRPNGLGLSSVRLIDINSRNGNIILRVAGADLMNGTPIYDIKPYIPYTDCHPHAKAGFADDVMGYSLEVDISDELLGVIEQGKRAGLIKILEHDPRPMYHDDPDREYGLSYGIYNVKFRVRDNILTVIEVDM